MCRPGRTKGSSNRSGRKILFDGFFVFNNVRVVWIDYWNRPNCNGNRSWIPSFVQLAKKIDISPCFFTKILLCTFQSNPSKKIPIWRLLLLLWHCDSKAQLTKTIRLSPPMISILSFRQRWKVRRLTTKIKHEWNRIRMKKCLAQNNEFICQDLWNAVERQWVKRTLHSVFSFLNPH